MAISHVQAHHAYSPFEYFNVFQSTQLALEHLESAPEKLNVTEDSGDFGVRIFEISFIFKYLLAFYTIGESIILISVFCSFFLFSFINNNNYKNRGKYT